MGCRELQKLSVHKTYLNLQLNPNFKPTLVSITSPPGCTVAPWNHIEFLKKSAARNPEDIQGYKWIIRVLFRDYIGTFASNSHIPFMAPNVLGPPPPEFSSGLRPCAAKETSPCVLN